MYLKSRMRECRCGNEFTDGTHAHNSRLYDTLMNARSRYIFRALCDEVPDIIYSVAGTVTFIIGFTGCVGALRENTCLLAAVSVLWDSIKLSLDYFNCSISFETFKFDWASGSLRDIHGLSLPCPLPPPRDRTKVPPLKNVTFKSI